MKPFPLLSALGRPFSARERRTIMLGLGIVLAGLAVAWGALPLANYWRTREQTIAAELDRLARLRGLVASEARLRELVELKTNSLAAGQQRLLAGRTPALAASALQSVVQGFADQSQVTVSHLDVTGPPDSTSATLPSIPANVMATGDVYGITELLSLIQNGSVVLEITELNLRPNPALKGELLQIGLILRSPYLGS